MKKHLLFIGALFVLSSSAFGMNNNQVSSRQGEDDILKIIFSFIGGDQYMQHNDLEEYTRRLSNFSLKDLKKLRLVSKKLNKLVTSYVNKLLQTNWIDRKNINVFTTNVAHGEYNPLQLATLSNNHDLIRLCLDLGSDREIITGGLQTAYDLAKGYRSKEILKPWHVVHDVASIVKNETNKYLDNDPIANIRLITVPIATLLSLYILPLAYPEAIPGLLTSIREEAKKIYGDSHLPMSPLALMSCSLDMLYALFPPAPMILIALCLAVSSGVLTTNPQLTTQHWRKTTNLILFFCYAFCLLIGYNNS